MSQIMPKIHILPVETTNQIAAGEVIERPASVVKELVENAIDAGARSVYVDVVDAGLSRIQVTDDGSGMLELDAALSFLPHATSKISQASDLEKIQTLGFRGEALASIAAVSRMDIRTKTVDADAGIHLHIEAGQKQTQKAVGMPHGTVILVADLFYNTPARKKFLRSLPAENTSISDLMVRFAMAYTNIRFHYTNNGQMMLQSTGSGDIKEVAMDIYGVEVARRMMEVHDQIGEIGIHAIISPPDVTRGTRKHITIFVNGRYVQSPSISQCIVDAYHTMLPLHQYPIAVVNLSVPCHQVDVNVHPAKTEIRIHQETQVCQVVTQSIRNVLIDADRSGNDRKIDPIMSNRSILDSHDLTMGLLVQESYSIASNGSSVHEDLPVQVLIPDVKPLSKIPWKVIGQIFSTFIIVEMGEELILLDQHAAAERILYEKLLTTSSLNPWVSQALLIPLIITLTPPEYALIISAKDYLYELGFHIDPAGGRSISLREVPVTIPISKSEQVVKDILDDLISVSVGTARKHLLREQIVLAACRASIKAQDHLTRPEMDGLITQLMATQYPYTCPHGRPTMIRFPRSELEKKFKRI